MSQAQHVVHGPPGTGKTHFIAEQVARAQEKYGPEGVMLASFTRAAANEVGARAGVPANTLNGHAIKALARAGLMHFEDKNGGPQLADTPTGIRVWNEWIATGEAETVSPAVQTWKMDARGSDPEEPDPDAGVAAGDELLRLLNRMRALRIPADERPAQAEMLSRGRVLPHTFKVFEQAWETFKRLSMRLDFTDTIEQALLRELAPPGDPEVMFVDEAQDNTRLEIELIRHWATGLDHVVTVGDPLQCLYEWRGADPKAMMPADATTTRVLERSYRVPRAVLDYAVKWAQEGQLDPPSYLPRLEHGHEAPGEVEARDLTLRTPRALAAALEAELDEGRTVMVLTSCSFMLGGLIAELRRRGVPFWNPYRLKNGAWNPMRSTARLTAFLRPARSVWGEQARFWSAGDARKWIDPLSVQKAPLRERGGKGRLLDRLKLIEDERAPGVPLASGELFPLFAEEAQDWAAFDLDAEWWHEALLDKAQRTNAYPIEVWRRDPALLRATPRLVLGTVHSVKGGQADVVYVFPDLTNPAMREWEDHDPALYRQFYVAFTRARERLVICQARSSRFALDLPRP